MKKIRIAVLMGGPSAEHEISLKSGRMVLKFLDKNKYAARPIIISKNGRWPITLPKLKKSFDVAFIAMHGEYGEDGTIQSILEKYKIPYTGSPAKASRLGMDKIKSLILFKKAGLNIPPRTKKMPLVVKPADRGSSVGTSIVKNIDDLPRAIKSAKKYSPKILIEKYIEGREITCGVIEKNGRLIALPSTEIIPKTNTFFDYHAKYTPGASLEITPAPNLMKKTIRGIQTAALKAHQAIGARGFSRTDMIIEKSKGKSQKSKIYVLEINTIPGLTKMSLLPQEAKTAGISFSTLLDIIIESALKKN